jgi:hypothetical protein
MVLKDSKGVQINRGELTHGAWQSTDAAAKQDNLFEINYVMKILSSIHHRMN